MMPSDGAWQSLGAAGARSRLIDLMRWQGPGGARGERRSSSTSTARRGISCDWPASSQGRTHDHQRHLWPCHPVGQPCRPQVRLHGAATERTPPEAKGPPVIGAGVGFARSASPFPPAMAPRAWAKLGWVMGEPGKADAFAAETSLAGYGRPTRGHAVYGPYRRVRHLPSPRSGHRSAAPNASPAGAGLARRGSSLTSPSCAPNRTGPRSPGLRRGPVPRRPASGYAVPQRRYPAARAGCTRGLGPQARECAPQAGSRGVTARRRRRAGPGAGRPARTGPR